MNVFKKLLTTVDQFQRKHKFIGFPYAVIKKFGDDEAGYQAALITYYGFLSLFPLLLVLTTVAGIIGRHHPELGQRLVNSASSYFPVLGQQLDSSVKGLNKGGPALVIGILFTLYGARGVADAFRHTINHVWQIPKTKRSGFPWSLLRSLGIIVGGGGGLLITAGLAGWASAAGHGIVFRIDSLLINLVLLSLVFILVLKLSLPTHISIRQLWVGASVTAIGLSILQVVGGYVVTHESHSLSNSYSALFATTLGLLAWIYLQAQIFIYAIEIDAVRNFRLWPRSLAGKELTAQDRAVYRRQARKEQAVETEAIQAHFPKK